MCFHLCKPLICYLFITATLQSRVDFTTQWNSRSWKSSFFFFNLELFTLCECEHDSKLVDDQSLITHQRTSDLLFHVILPNRHYSFFICLIRLCCLLFDVDSACKQPLCSLFLPVRHLKMNSCCVIFCVLVFRQRIDKRVEGVGKECCWEVLSH